MSIIKDVITECINEIEAEKIREGDAEENLQPPIVTYSKLDLCMLRSNIASKLEGILSDKLLVKEINKTGEMR